MIQIINSKSFIYFSILLIFNSCDNPTKKTPNTNIVAQTDTILVDSTNILNPLEERIKKIPKNIKPVFGYRFVISGDFDGDGKKEKLTEHFISSLDYKETNKFYDSLIDYEQLVDLTVQKEPISFVLSNNNRIDTLQISSGGQLLGVSYLKNEGDLNGDGTDEVSYVVHIADWSNFNTWHIMTYHKNKWKELYSFSIWDWQIPDLPQTYNQYGLFGLEQKIINTTNDTINRLIEKEIKSFKGLIKKISTNKIQIIFRNDESMLDTMVVNLKKIK